MDKIISVLKESYFELTHKVTWPSWESLQASTVVVLVFTLLLSIIVFFMDLTSKTVLEFIYSLG